MQGQCSNEIKIISLVHEIVDSYSTRYLQDVFDRSQVIIFPAKFVQSFAHNKLRATIKSSRELIIPNALLAKRLWCIRSRSSPHPYQARN